MTDNRFGQGLTAGEPIGVPDLPDVFFEAVRRRFSLDGSGRMLALWRGAGAFLPFAGDFESILLVDPEPGRLAESMWEAERLGIENAIFLEGRREILHPRMGRFRLVIVQDSFLRKDRKRCLSFLANMTEPEGGVVIADVQRYGPPADWQKAALDVLRDRIGGGLSESRPTGSTVWDEQSLPFQYKANCTYRWTQKRTIEQAVTDILSAWPPTLKERADSEEALRAVFKNSEPSGGVLEERLQLTAVFAWNGPDERNESAGGNGC